MVEHLEQGSVAAPTEQAHLCPPRRAWIVPGARACGDADRAQEPSPFAHAMTLSCPDTPVIAKTARLAVTMIPGGVSFAIHRRYHRRAAASNQIKQNLASTDAGIGRQANEVRLATSGYIL